MSLAMLFMGLARGARPVFVAAASTQNSGSSSSLVINKPAGTAAGDLMVAIVGVGDGIPTTRSWTGDTGWTEVADEGNSPGLRVAWKIAASEGSSYTFTCSGSTLLGGSILTYRGTHQTTPISVVGAVGRDTSASNGTTLTAAGVTVPSNLSILIAAFNTTGESVTLSTPTNMASRASNSDATKPSWNICDQDVESGASGDRVSTITGNGGVGEMVLLAIAHP